MIDEQRFARVLAWLLRNEGVSAVAIERAVASASDMRPGTLTTLDGDEPQPQQMRRAFVHEQLRLLTKP